MMQTQSLTAAKASQGQEEVLSVSGNTITVKVAGAETNDAYSIFELLVPPNVGAGLHIDKRWDEWWHVIEGTFSFTLNGERKELSAGGFAHGPKGIAHSFKNVGERTGKLLMLTMPSGLEKFFKDIHQASLQGRSDKESFVAMMRLHHIEPA
jgi:mannose-6-phosphate isomerase-like protein (cupin superfamily)